VTGIKREFINAVLGNLKQRILPDRESNLYLLNESQARYGLANQLPVM
jgi:hypothetical protein